MARSARFSQVGLLLSLAAVLCRISFRNTEDTKCTSTFQTLLLCGTVEQTEDDRGQFSLTCPDGHTLTDLQASGYRSRALECPDNPYSSNSAQVCQYESGVNADLLQADLTVCAGLQTCSNIYFQLRPSGADQCQDEGFTGRFYHVVKYRCEPQFSRYLNGSAWALAMNKEETRSASMINVNSLASALMGNFVSDLDTYCSFLIPAGLDVIIRPVTFLFVPSSASGPWVEILDGTTTYRIYSSSDPAVQISCSERERRLNLKYNSDDPNVSVVFVIQVQVSHAALMTATCGIPLSNWNRSMEQVTLVDPVDPSDEALRWWSSSNSTLDQPEVDPRLNETGDPSTPWWPCGLSSLGIYNMNLEKIIIAAAAIVGGFVVIITVIILICRCRKRNRRAVFYVQQEPKLSLSSGLKSDSNVSGCSYTRVDEDQKKKLCFDDDENTLFEHI